MELSGWILMLASWSAIGGLAGFCMRRVLTGRKLEPPPQPEPSEPGAE